MKKVDLFDDKSKDKDYKPVGLTKEAMKDMRRSSRIKEVSPPPSDSECNSNSSMPDSIKDTAAAASVSDVVEAGCEHLEDSGVCIKHVCYKGDRLTVWKETDRVLAT